jgi:3-oxoacyl-[acyl-carrier protein] reductase
VIFPGRFADRVAVITGGADGIGKAVAARIASEGGTVALFDVNEALMEKTRAGLVTDCPGAMALRVDITDEDQVRRGIAHVAGKAGRLDIMVNCAGIPGPNNVGILDYSAQDFERVCRINLHGAFLMCKYSLAEMKRHDYGRVLLLSSIGGKEGNPGMIGYAASKSGVIGLVKGLGKEFAKSGIRVNGLAPAVIRTALLDAVTPEQLKYMTDKIPMGRVGTVSEVAAISSWIVSEECSFTTGFVFDISGGRATF